MSTARGIEAIAGYTYLIAAVLLPVALVLITVLRPGP